MGSPAGPEKPLFFRRANEAQTDRGNKMTLRRIFRHFADQDWFAVCIELIVVVVGVFIGIQVANWNEERLEAARKQQIIGALITAISDSISVQQRFVDEIDAGLVEWERAHARGDSPAPYYFRIEGSDTAPDIWGTLQQMQLADLFDPVTLFDLSFYYSELAGVGRKYIRYVTFVEDNILPYAKDQPEWFYEADGLSLKPVYRANLERLKEFRNEAQRFRDWEKCLAFRLQSEKTFDSTCLRANYVLDGMNESARVPMP